MLGSTRGNVYLAPRGHHINCIFRSTQLFPRCGIHNGLHCNVTGDVISRFSGLITLLNVRPLLSHLPNDLSKNRGRHITVNQTLLATPRLLLLSRPLTSLSVPHGHRLLPCLRHLAQRVGVPVLCIDRSLSRVLRLTSEIVMLRGNRIGTFNTLRRI